jgi:hypothetical protein
MGVAVPVAAFGVVRDSIMPGVSTVFNPAVLLADLALGIRTALKESASGNNCTDLDVDWSYTVLVNVGVGGLLLLDFSNLGPPGSNYFGLPLNHETGGTSAIYSRYGILYSFPGIFIILKSTLGLSIEI